MDFNLENKLKNFKLKEGGLETIGPVGKRLILIVDEIEPGKYAMDTLSNLHPAQSAIVCLTAFRKFAAEVSDEFARMEIVKQQDEIFRIVSGKPEEKKQEPPAEGPPTP